MSTKSTTRTVFWLRIIGLATILIMIAMLVAPALALATGQLNPTGPGYISQWSGLYTGIDEGIASANCGGGDYISTATIGNRSSFTINLNTVPNGAIITDVNVLTADRGDNAAGGTYSTFVRLNGANSADSTVHTVTGTGGACTGFPNDAFNVTDTVKGAGTTLEIGVVKVNNTNLRVGAMVAVVTYKTATTTTVTSNNNPSIYGTSVTFTATVNQAGAAGTVEFYDGATLLGTGTLSGGTPNTATYATSALNVATHSITAKYLGNADYYTSTSSVLSQVVNKRNLTVTATGVNKVYDGTTAATVTLTTDAVGGDDVTASYTSAAFADANVANGINVSVSGISISGAAAGNYNLLNTTASTTANITPAAATITVNGYTGEYDGVAHGATLVSAVGVNSEDLSASVNLGSSFTDVPGGTAHWTFANGNYVSQSGDVDITITAKELTVSGLSASDKVYDGTDAATITGIGTLPGVIPPDDVSLAGTPTGTFSDANVGNGKTVTISGLSLAGADMGNYTLTVPTLTADITPAAATINVTGYTGVYDGAAHGASLVSAVGVNSEDLTAFVDLGSSFTNVPGGTAHWTFDNSNYVSQSGDVDITITPAAATINVTGYTGVYDGLPHGANLVSAVGVNSEDLSASVNLGSTFTNVPGGTAHWTFANGNYVSQNGDVDITLTPAAATINVTGYTGVYDGLAHGANLVSAVGVNSEDLTASVDLGLTFTNVPGGTAHWTFDNGNYVSQSGDVDITITSAAATINVTGYTGVYDGLAHGATLVSAVGVNSEDLTAFVDLGSSFTNVPGGTAHWTFANGNYVSQNGDVDIIISQAPSTVALTCPVSVVYNGLAQEPCTAEATGVGMSAVDLTSAIVYGDNLNAGTATADVSWAGDVNHIGDSDSATFEITPLPVTVTVDSGQFKVYGDADPVFTYTYAPALIGGDSFTGALARVAGENVGLYAINDLGTLTAGSNYALTLVPANFSITVKPITVTATAGQTKFYGDADPVFNYSVSPSLIAGDSFTGALDRALGEDVGLYAIGKGTLNAGPNYDMTFVSHDFQILPKAITVTVDPGQFKIYGAANPASYTYSYAPSLVGGDAFTGALTRDAGENVGFYAINKGSLDLGANYDITFVSDDFEIKPLAVTVTVDPGQFKVYGAADPAAYTYTYAPALIGGDAFTGALTRDAGEDVGLYSINKGTLDLGANYDITFVSDNFEITPLDITVTADPGQFKVYGDADPVFTYSVSPALIAGDSFTGALARVGGEDVGLYAMTQGTLDAGLNYNITFVSDDFEIVVKPITVTADSGQNKVYGDADPVFDYSVSPSLIAGDSFTGALDRALGEDVGFYAINQGTLDAGTNYAITFVSAQFQITPKALTVSGLTADDKDYDGTVVAIISGTGSLVGVVGLDDVSLAGTPAGAFADKHAGVDKPVTISGLSLTGADAGNYTLTAPSDAATIFRLAITVTAVTDTKVYDGTTASAGVPTIAPALMAGDTAAFTQSFDTKDIGTGKTLSPAGSVNDGNGGANYDVTLVNDTTGEITAKDLNVTADDKTIVQGDPDPAFTFTAVGFVSPDAFVTAPTCNVADPHTAVGTYDILCSGGDAGVNYSIHYFKGTLTVLSPNSVPTDITLSGSTVVENSPVGTTVGSFATVDADVTDTHTYSFCGGADDASFSIATVNVLKTAAVFDFEAKPSYAICVRTDDGNGGTFDKNFTITVVDVPGLELLDPLNAAVLHYNRPTFDWVNFPGAIGYQIQIAKKANFAMNQRVLTRAIAGGANSFYTMTTNLPANKVLYWRVRPKMTPTKFGAWSEVRSLTTANPPSIPVLQSPAGGALVNGPSPLFNWANATVPAGATFDHYQFQIATDKAFTNMVDDQNIAGVTNSQYNGAVLTAGTTYYWRVRTFNTVGDYSAWSTVRSVKIRFNAPTLLTPADLSTVGSLMPTFTWNATPGATSYTIQLSKVSNFALVAVNKVVAGPTFTPTTNLTAATTYYWRVRANGAYGPSAWSTVFSFTTP